MVRFTHQNAFCYSSNVIGSMNMQPPVCLHFQIFWIVLQGNFIFEIQHIAQVVQVMQAMLYKKEIVWQVELKVQSYYYLVVGLSARSHVSQLQMCLRCYVWNDWYWTEDWADYFHTDRNTKKVTTRVRLVAIYSSVLFSVDTVVCAIWVDWWVWFTYNFE